MSWFLPLFLVLLLGARCSAVWAQITRVNTAALVSLSWCSCLTKPPPCSKRPQFPGKRSDGLIPRPSTVRSIYLFSFTPQDLWAGLSCVSTMPYSHVAPFHMILWHPFTCPAFLLVSPEILSTLSKRPFSNPASSDSLSPPPQKCFALEVWIYFPALQTFLFCFLILSGAFFPEASEVRNCLKSLRSPI